jgi:hypothetical protein
VGTSGGGTLCERENSALQQEPSGEAPGSSRASAQPQQQPIAAEVPSTVEPAAGADVSASAARSAGQPALAAADAHGNGNAPTDQQPAPAADADAPGSSSRGQSQQPGAEEEVEDDAGRPRSHTRGGRRPKYVTPVDELDESDAEAAQVWALPSSSCARVVNFAILVFTACLTCCIASKL